MSARAETKFHDPSLVDTLASDRAGFITGAAVPIDGGDGKSDRLVPPGRVPRPDHAGLLLDRDLHLGQLAGLPVGHDEAGHGVRLHFGE